MSLSLSIPVYLTLWWLVFLSILPLGVISHAEAGLDPGDGGDPAAPVDPKIKRKLITTTAVSTTLFAMIWLVMFFHLIRLPPLRISGL